MYISGWLKSVINYLLFLLACLLQRSNSHKFFSVNFFLKGDMFVRSWLKFSGGGRLLERSSALFPCWVI